VQSSIQVQHLTKQYRIGQGLASLRAALFGVRASDAVSGRYHWAVKDVNFEVAPGRALGIIGPNGAGKTTILKLLSRVTQPTSGDIRINGRMSALIELGAGFHPELTGRENVYLNGAILGMKRQEIRSRFDRIVDFAGIGKFLDTPVKRYSSGMYARLGFAIAAHIDPEVLLVDEVLAVGDFAFQAKCYARMEELRASGTALIFVSHNMEVVRQVCDHGLVMYRGEAIYQGTAGDAVIAYSDAVRKAAREVKKNVQVEDAMAQRVLSFDAEIERISLLDAAGKQVTSIQAGAEVRVAVDLVFHKDVHSPVFAMTIRGPDGHMVYDTTTRWMKIDTPDYHAGERGRVVYTLRAHLLDGTYELGADIASNDLKTYLDRVERAFSFEVRNDSGARGMADLGARVEFRAPVLPETTFP
jgi:lipopolysaccharide transport system ATP-binding protein